LLSSFLIFPQQLGQFSGGKILFFQEIDIFFKLSLFFTTEIILGITSQALFIKIVSQIFTSRFFISS
jgi:hypothetical protein